MLKFSSAMMSAAGDRGGPTSMTSPTMNSTSDARLPRIRSARCLAHATESAAVEINGQCPAALPERDPRDGIGGRPREVLSQKSRRTAGVEAQVHYSEHLGVCFRILHSPAVEFQRIHDHTPVELAC